MKLVAKLVMSDGQSVTFVTSSEDEDFILHEGTCVAEWVTIVQ